MPIKSPAFWEKDNSVASKLLTPFGKLYAFIAERRIKKAKPYRAKIPVICVGNLVMGGVGKTPLAVSIAEYFKMNGMRPVFLTRGYGGGLKRCLVDLDRHTAKDVGDEAMILARVAPTVVNADRAKGAAFAERIGAEVIIMDDGFQNPKLEKDLSFAVFDGRYGCGNGKVFPAGPLREPLADGLARANAFIVVGKDLSDVKSKIEADFPGLPFAAVHIEQDQRIIQQLLGKKLFAFAGIGFPAKFFDMLKDYGCDVVGTQAFSDHYPYTDDDLNKLAETARDQNAVLVTTAKDAVRVPKRFLPEVRVVEAFTVWDTPDVLCSLLSRFLKKKG